MQSIEYERVRLGVVHVAEVSCSKAGCTQNGTRWVVRLRCYCVVVVLGVMREMRFCHRCAE